MDLAEAACCGIDGGANDIAGDDEFNSAILLATCCVIVRGYWLGIAIALSCNRIGIDAGFDEVITHRAGAVFRQRLIHVVAANVIGVAANLDVDSRVGKQDAGNLGELLAGSRLQGVSACIE